MSAPATVAREALQEILNEEFKPERISVRPGFIDASLGQYGVVAGVVPSIEEPSPEDRNQLITQLNVEMFAAWNADPDPEVVVDPSTIEGYAYRFRLALAAYAQTPTSDVWWFQIDELMYEPDPTGNISRFVATVSAFGQNPAA